jgi:hypothetical protein
MIGTSEAWTFDATRSQVIADHGVAIRSVWRPALGAFFDDAGVSFRVWAPTRSQVDLLLEPGRGAQRCERLQHSPDGTLAGTFDAVRPGGVVAADLSGGIALGAAPENTLRKLMQTKAGRTPTSVLSFGPWCNPLVP